MTLDELHAAQGRVLGHFHAAAEHAGAARDELATMLSDQYSPVVVQPLGELVTALAELEGLAAVLFEQTEIGRQRSLS